MQTRDLTLFGCTKLVKTLGLSKLVMNRDILKEQEGFSFSYNRPLSLTNLRCKDYTTYFRKVKWHWEPTAVWCWSNFYPYFATRWEKSFDTIYKWTEDNKLRDFGYHRILVTNNELKKFKIKNEVLCKNPDSLEHIFLQCPTNVKFYHQISSWFNVSRIACVP